MSDEPNVDLNLSARQLRLLISDVVGLRDDVDVLTAIAIRQDGTLGALLGELRAMRSLHPEHRSASRARSPEHSSP